MAKQPIRGCEIHTTNLADRACDDDLFSFISKSEIFAFYIIDAENYSIRNLFYKKRIIL